MATSTFEAVAKQFIQSKTPEVLALKGPWGVGKTYAWRKFLEANKAHSHLKHYSYVSLFGITSTSSLSVAVISSTQSLETVGKSLTMESINHHWDEYLKQGARKARGLLDVVAVPHMKNISIAFDAIAGRLISDTVICLDDFERLSGMSPDELLGFVSSLKEEKNCKVVLIFNHEQLGQSEATYKRYREKVIDVELLYLPTAEEAAEIGIPNMARWSNLAREKAVQLGITNIRVLRKIAKVLCLLWPAIRDRHEGVQNQAVHTVVLLTWCLYEPEGKPTLEFLKHFNSFAYSFRKEKRDPERAENAIEDSWEGLLVEYGFLTVDDFDLALLKVVEHGYIEESGVIEAADKVDAMFRAQEVEASFSKAWSKFHNTFQNNEDDLVASLEESFRASVRHINAINLNATVRLLRQLGRDTLADELLDHYVSEREGEPEVFDLSEYPFAGDIDDATVRRRFAEVSKLRRPLPTLQEAVGRMAKGNYGGRDEQALKAASARDLYELFLADHGSDLHKVIRAVIREPDRGIRRRARAALKAISRQSRVNALRVSRHLK